MNYKVMVLLMFFVVSVVHGQSNAEFIIAGNTSSSNYSVSMTIRDVAGNTSSNSYNVYLNSINTPGLIDNQPPIITFVSPVSGTNFLSDNSSVYVQFTAVDNNYVVECWHTVNGGSIVHNPSCSNFSQDFVFGSNNIIIYANDSHNNVGLSSVWFTITKTTGSGCTGGTGGTGGTCTIPPINNTCPSGYRLINDTKLNMQVCEKIDNNILPINTPITGILIVVLIVLFIGFILMRDRKNRNKVKNMLPIGVFLLMFMFFTVSPVLAMPLKVPYGGTLFYSNNTAVNGTTIFLFTIYNSQTGGSNLWSETQTLNVTKGVFSTLLGNNVPITISNFDQDLYLEVNVEGEVLSPRSSFGSSIYSFNSNQTNFTKSNSVSLGNHNILGNLNVTGFTNTSNVYISTLTSCSNGLTTNSNGQVICSTVNFNTSINTLTGNIIIRGTSMINVTGNTTDIVISYNNNSLEQLDTRQQNNLILIKTKLNDSDIPVCSGSNKLERNSLGTSLLCNPITTLGQITGETVFRNNVYIVGSNLYLINNTNVTFINQTTLNVNGSFFPTFTNMYNIGSPDLLWSNIYSTTGNFSTLIIGQTNIGQNLTNLNTYLSELSNNVTLFNTSATNLDLREQSHYTSTVGNLSTKASLNGNVIFNQLEVSTTTATDSLATNTIQSNGFGNVTFWQTPVYMQNTGGFTDFVYDYSKFNFSQVVWIKGTNVLLNLSRLNISTTQLEERQEKDNRTLVAGSGMSVTYNTDKTVTLTSTSTVGANRTLGMIVGFSSFSFSGNVTNGTLRGYQAANNICNAEYSGSHFCQEIEVLNTIINGTVYTGTYWMARGAPGYTASANDCKGWTTNVSTELGPFWNWGYDVNSPAGAGVLTNCLQTKQLSCCR